MNLNNYSTEDIIDCLPQNRPLYKDSGLWQIRTDDMENVYIQQLSNESLRDFIIRYVHFMTEYESNDSFLTNISCKKPM